LPPRVVRSRESARAPLERQERPERQPLSFSQQRLVVPGSLQAIQRRVQHGRGATPSRASWTLRHWIAPIPALIERHESLRTHFGEHEGEPFQIIELERRIISAGGKSSAGWRKRSSSKLLRRALRKEAQEPFDLSRGPLLRIRLLKLGLRDHVLLWSCHHIIF